jgi:hypothetical protein
VCEFVRGITSDSESTTVAIGMAIQGRDSRVSIDRICRRIADRLEGDAPPVGAETTVVGEKLPKRRITWVRSGDGVRHSGFAIRWGVETEPDGSSECIVLSDVSSEVWGAIVVSSRSIYMHRNTPSAECNGKIETPRQKVDEAWNRGEQPPAAVTRVARKVFLTSSQLTSVNDACQ